MNISSKPKTLIGNEMTFKTTVFTTLLNVK